MRIYGAGLLKIFLALTGAVLLAPMGHAASLQWKSLSDRERLTITISTSDGLIGGASRVDPKALMLPFTEVPADIIIQTQPDGAKLFRRTERYGNALGILTQTPEFGFVVTKHTPTEIIIDLFPDPLGARWKPSGQVMPTTESTPQEAKDAAAAAQASRGQEARGEVEVDRSPQPASRSEGKADGPASGGIQPHFTNSSAPLQPAATQGQNPQAQPLQPSGAIAQENPGNVEQPIQRTPPAGVSGNATSPKVNTSADSRKPAVQPGMNNKTSSSPIKPFLDSREQTAYRRDALPTPSPLHASEPVIAVEAVSDSPAWQAPAGPQAADSPEAYAGSDAGAPAKGAGAGSEKPSGSREVPQEGAGQVSLQTVQGSAKAGEGDPGFYGQNSPYLDVEDEELPIGSAVFTGPGVSYRARANFGGTEGLEIPKRAPQPEEAAGGQVAPDLQAEKAHDTAEGSITTNSSKGAEASSVSVAESGEGQEGRRRIYVDEAGNEVEPPADPAQVIPEIGRDIAAGNYQGALEKADLLLQQGNLDQDQRALCLHVRAESLFALGQDDFHANYQRITAATKEAINAELQSDRNAAAYLRLGYMNLELKNVQEADNYFTLLRRHFPQDDGVPLTYYYWGKYFYEQGEPLKAADQFQYVLEKFPNSKPAREAALGLARAFHRMGYYQKAYDVVEYIGTKWSQYYLDYPPFLNMIGDVAFRLNKLDDALKFYWLYLNLEPDGADAGSIMTRIGDIYGMTRSAGAASAVYKESVARFPDSEGGLVAQMRLAEASAQDDPTIGEMFTVFQDRPFSATPEEVYKGIIRDHPDSPLAPLATLKLAMWHLWKHEYITALDVCTEFMEKYPKDKLVSKVEEVALKTFSTLAAEGLAQGQYAQVRAVWERYPIVQSQGEILSPESRFALAVSSWQEGKTNDALRLVTPFFLGHKVPKYSELALNLVLQIYLDIEQWSAIEKVARQIELWELTPQSRMYLDYALALADENLGRHDAAQPIWQKLYDTGRLPEEQMAYAVYFLAKGAEKKGDLEKTYLLGTEALRRLLAMAEVTHDAADVGKIRSQIDSLIVVTEKAGRLQEALQYVEQYKKYLTPEDPDWPSLLYKTARIYRAQGNQSQWTQLLTELSQKYPEDVYGKWAARALKGGALRDNASQYSPTGQL